MGGWHVLLAPRPELGGHYAHRASGKARFASSVGLRASWFAGLRDVPACWAGCEDLRQIDVHLPQDTLKPERQLERQGNQALRRRSSTAYVVN